MKRRKVGAMYVAPTANIPEGVPDIDQKMFKALDEKLIEHVQSEGGTLLGKINHLRESYPSDRSNSKPNLGEMTDWRAWAFMGIPE